MDNFDRRSFLGAFAGAGGGWLLGCSGKGGVLEGSSARDRIGVQLYTLRDRLREDFEGTLAQVSAIGYAEVEPHDYFGRTPEQVRATLDGLGLSAPSAHIGLARFRQDLDGLFGAAETVGHRYVVVPSVGAESRTSEGFHALAAELNRYGAAARARGLRVGYHNHDFEFAALPGGRTGIEILLAETDPELVEFELDLFWAVKGGSDPVDLIAQDPSRFPLWHVKDMADLQGAQRMVDVGAGEIDFRRIFAHADTAGLRHFFVEHDNPGDSLASIRASYGHLHSILS